MFCGYLFRVFAEVGAKEALLPRLLNFHAEGFFSRRGILLTQRDSSHTEGFFSHRGNRGTEFFLTQKFSHAEAQRNLELWRGFLSYWSSFEL